LAFSHGFQHDGTAWTFFEASEVIMRKERDKDEVLADAGIEVTQTHLIADGRRHSLAAIASYGPERKREHYRAPLVTGLSGGVFLLVGYAGLEGMASTAGTVALGLGALLLIDATVWALIAQRAPALELVSESGHRWRVSLPNAEVMTRVLTTLDEAMASSKR
jgi:hypothetical protein